MEVDLSKGPLKKVCRHKFQQQPVCGSHFRQNIRNATCIIIAYRGPINQAKYSRLHMRIRKEIDKWILKKVKEKL